MNRICVITGTRAEYGLLYPLISRISNDPDLVLDLVVTGSHLSAEFGLTYKIIEDDGFSIARKIEILLSSDSAGAVSKAMGLAMIGFGEYFETERPELVIVLGDRFEILAAVTAAVVARIPVAHIHGGEVTEGAYDEYFRHSITKMSALHFTSNSQHMNRVIQLGEQPANVYNVGAIGIENIRNLKYLTFKELEASLDFRLDKEYALVTFHPATLDNDGIQKEVEELLSALDGITDMSFIITKANADNGGREVNRLIENFVAGHSDRFICFSSLGQLRYLSAMKYAAMVIGNSSSGIIEAPSLHVPTINIGSRQKGRLAADSVIHCRPLRNDIVNAVRRARTPEFKNMVQNVANPYGDGNVSSAIIQIIKERLANNNIPVMKLFHDIDVLKQS